MSISYRELYYSAETGGLVCSVRLPPDEAVILGVLAKKFPDVASFDELGDALYGMPDLWPEWWMSSIRVRLCHLRKKLRKLMAVEINCVFMKGYRLSEAIRFMECPP